MQRLAFLQTELLANSMQGWMSVQEVKTDLCGLTALSLPLTLCADATPCAFSHTTQARAVIDGLPADIVALALPLDVQKIADAGLLSPDWRKLYPLQSVGAYVCG